MKPSNTLEKVKTTSEPIAQSTRPITKRYVVFVDYENTQCLNAERLENAEYSFIIFIGSQQTKMPVETLTRVSTYANALRFIQVSGTGSNNLDFHLCAEIGIYHTQEELSTEFVILSNDTGFDALVKYFSTQKGRVIRRVTTLTSVIQKNNVKSYISKPVLNKSVTSTQCTSTNSSLNLITRTSRDEDDTAEKAKSYYNGRIRSSNTRPRTVKSLKNDIDTFFGHRLTAEEVKMIYLELLENRVLLANNLVHIIYC